MLFRTAPVGPVWKCSLEGVETNSEKIRLKWASGIAFLGGVGGPNNGLPVSSFPEAVSVASPSWAVAVVLDKGCLHRLSQRCQWTTKWAASIAFPRVVGGP